MQVSWDMWEHRNGIKHSNENKATIEEHKRLNERISQELETGSDEVANADKDHFNLPNGYETDWEIQEKQKWLEHTDTIRAHFRLKREAIRKAAESQRTLMETWLGRR